MSSVTYGAHQRVCGATGAVLTAALALVGCGSSADTYTAPSAIPRCGVRIESSGSTVPAAGGTGSITVRTERECQWTAEPDAAWLAVTSGKSGQGDGTVQFGAGPNPDPVVRTGGIMLNGQRAAITQAAAECRFELGSTAASFPSAGGTGTVDVRASSPLCTWAATSSADWIAISAGASGRGSGTVTFGVASTTGPGRSGALTIAGFQFSVAQSEQQCTFQIAPLAHSVGAPGGSRSVTIAVGEGCSWTAVSNVPWISITSPPAGSGPGTLTFDVAPTTGPSRSGTVTIAGQPVSVTQSPGCAFEVAPANHTADASGGNRTVNVGAAAGCVWSASSNVSWITITSAASGSGPGAVTFAIAATSGPARSGSLTVAGQTVTVVQGQGCAYSIAPVSQNVPAGGGNGTITVATNEGCSWTASSNAQWIRVTAGASSSGNGTVTFSVDATNGPSRSGTLTVAGRTFTVNQGQGCTFSLSSASASAPAEGATGTVEVRTANGCTWSASSSDASWLRITGGGSGSGTGTVAYAVSANTGPARTATITAGGQRFTVTQQIGCSFAVSPTSHNVASGGGTLSTTVSAPAGCTWTARSDAPWIAFSSATSGSGDGAVSLVAAPSTDAERRGNVIIAGQTVTVVQASGCVFSIAPTGQAVPAAGAPGSFSVGTSGTCTWNAIANADWVAITAGVSGAGPGAVQFNAAPNAGGARTGTITAAGQTFTITQAPSCSASVTPDTLTATAAGGSNTVAIATLPECSWSAASNAPWIVIASAPSGSGNANVQVDVQPNTGPARTGTATLAGRTVTVNQDSGCTIGISPTSVPMPIEGGAGSVSVTTAEGCVWGAASTVPWIVVTSATSGSGPGAVQFGVEANGTGAPRAGTITIGTQVFTVNQAGPGL